MPIRTNVCSVPVDKLSMSQTVSLIDQAIASGDRIQHVVINASKVIQARRDVELLQVISNCAIINADGQSIVWASRILGDAVPERVTGIDLMDNLMGLASKRGYRVFLFGATKDVVGKVAAMYEKKYGNQIIAGFRDGYYSENEEPLIARDISNVKPDMLFVAMGSPKKEKFLSKHKDYLNIPFVMGVGGSFDVIAGKVKRAPSWMQKFGLEWLFRVIQEPSRMWKRYLITNTLFIAAVIKAKLQTR